MSYAEVFKNLDERTIEATKNLIKGGFWKKELSNSDKVDLCIGWLKEVSDIYSIETPEFNFDLSQINYRMTGGGCYNPIEVKINLFYKFSLVTLLHEFRHHMQNVKRIPIYRSDIEHDARAWSCSLFKAAAPDSYKKAVENGTIYFN